MISLDFSFLKIWILLPLDCGNDLNLDVGNISTALSQREKCGARDSVPAKMKYFKIRPMRPSNSLLH